jgi:hypothetical protein
MLDRLPLNQQDKRHAGQAVTRRGPGSAASRALRPLRGVLLAVVVAAALVSPDLALAAKRFSFAGTTSQHRVMSFQIPYSFQAVTRLNIFWSARCASGATLDTNSVASRVPFNRPRFRWAIRGAYSYTAADSSYSAAAGRALTFAVTAAGTGMIPFKHLPRGVWTAHTVVTDPVTGQAVDTCDTGKVTWKADII